MTYKYAVTTDAGKTWELWDITKDLPDAKTRRAAIKDIRIDNGGHGTMELQPFTGWNTQTPKLQTNDYGRHWNES